MPIRGDIYAPLVTRQRNEGFATLGDFFQQFDQQRANREARKDREEARAIQRQDRELRGQEIAMRQQAIDAQRRKLETDEQKVAATKALIQQHTTPEGIDYEGVLEGLYTVDPDAAMEFDKHLNERAKTRTERERAELELRMKQLEGDKTSRDSYLERLAVAKTPEQWAEVWADASENKMLRTLKGTGLSGQFTPEGPTMAADLIRGVKGRDEAAIKAATAANTDADNARADQAAKATEAYRQEQLRLSRQRLAQGSAASEPMESVIGPDGKPVLVRRSRSEGMTPATTREQPSEDERKSAGFYRQMQEAIQILDQVEGQLSQKDLYQIQTLPQEQLIGLANRGQMSEAAKRYLRAFEQFTEARMRPVSGAAISDSEFARDRRTYAKQYAETPQLAADRRKARNTALESLKDRAMRALPKPDESKAKTDPLGIR